MTQPDRTDRIECIPFNISLTEASYKGEIHGKPLKAHRVFDVKLNSGEEFSIEAIPDKERAGYNWFCYTRDKFSKIVPLIGRVIERYFSKN